MNLLLGVLVTVVDVTTKAKKERLVIDRVQQTVIRVITELGYADDQHLTKEEFWAILSHEETLQILHDVRVDALGLLDYADILFQSDKFGRSFDKRIHMNDFME